MIADLDIQSMAKAVEYLPGITMGQGEGHRDAPSIRGQSSTADFFVDGVRDDKFYQNVFATSAVNAPGTQFMLGAYNDAVDRRSLFTQNDAVWKTERGGVRSTFPVGTELSRQQSDNVRKTGYFNSSRAFNDATRLVQSGHPRSTGAELGVQGSPLNGWSVTGGLAVQQARIISRTAAARLGATAALVPHTTASLFNKVRVLRGTSVAVGVVHQARRYAAIDNSVMLPAFTRIDDGLYLTLPRGLAAQLNVENVFDTRRPSRSSPAGRLKVPKG